MNDQTLLAFGGAVAFITVAGTYVYLCGRVDSGVSQDRSDATSSQAKRNPVKEE